MTALANQIGFQLLVATVFLAVGAILASIFLARSHGKSPRLHRLVWALVLVQGVMVFQVPITIRSIKMPLNPQSNSAVTSDNQAPHLESASSLAGASGVHSFPNREMPTYRFNSIVLLVGVWVAGAVLIMVMWGVRYMVFIRNLPCSLCDVAQWNEEWEEVFCGHERIDPNEFLLEVRCEENDCRHTHGFEPLVKLHPTRLRIVILAVDEERDVAIVDDGANVRIAEGLPFELHHPRVPIRVDPNDDPLLLHQRCGRNELDVFAPDDRPDVGAA